VVVIAKCLGGRFVDIVYVHRSIIFSHFTVKYCDGYLYSRWCVMIFRCFGAQKHGIHDAAWTLGSRHAVSCIPRLHWCHWKKVFHDYHSLLIYSVPVSHLTCHTWVLLMKMLYHVFTFSSLYSCSVVIIIIRVTDKPQLWTLNGTCTGWPRKLHISICLMLNWYSFVKSQTNFIIFGRLTPK